MSTDLIKVNVNGKTTIEITSGTTLKEIKDKLFGKDDISILAAKIDNEITELLNTVDTSCNIQFLDPSDEDSQRIYRRSLYFIMLKAFREIFPDKSVILGHSLHKSIFCEIENENAISALDLKRVEERMREISNNEIPFIKKMEPIEKAKQIFVNTGRADRFKAINERKKNYVTIYECGGYEDYFYGYMAPHTGYVKLFSLIPYGMGFILIYPDKADSGELPAFKEQTKLYSVFKEYRAWAKILGVDSVGSLNEMITNGHSNEIIRVSEALQEKKIAQIADLITNNKDKKRMALIAGPSSSGKTSFANRLAIQIRVNGKKPVTISLDDYYVDREKSPRDETGDYDFEALEALDIPTFNDHLVRLLAGECVEIPVFNFQKGTREPIGKRMQIDEDSILVIEGIHGLNDRLTSAIPPEAKFKIYVSALTNMNIDNHNRIPSTDNRILRRIVRDYQFRGFGAASTIARWPSVRRGEEKNIFPYQENADIMFNSALIYELSALKTIAEPLLAEIGKDKSEHSEALRLLEFLSYFKNIDTSEVPFNSIVREFIGGSCFFK